jgi:hypothetical protein
MRLTAFCALALAVLRPVTCAAQLLADGQAGGVVGSAVDAEARGQLLEALAHLAVGDVQAAVGVHRGRVLVDAKTHGAFPPGDGCRSGGRVGVVRPAFLAGTP